MTPTQGFRSRTSIAKLARVFAGVFHKSIDGRALAAMIRRRLEIAKERRAVSAVNRPGLPGGDFA